MGDVHLVAAVLIEQQDDILFVQEGKEHIHGLWNLPAGGVQDGEKMEDAAQREAAEEAGINITIQHLTGIYYHSRRSNTDVLIFVYAATTSDTPSTPENDEILDVQYRNPDTISEAEFRSPYIQQAITDHRGNNTLPADLITYLPD